MIVLDPPKLILDRDEISAGKRKYFDLNVLAMKLVEPGGLLVTCSCSGLLGPQDFLALLGAAARNAGRDAQLLALTGAAPDHPVALDALEGAYLKVAWLRLGGESRNESSPPALKRTVARLQCEEFEIRANIPAGPSVCLDAGRGRDT